MVLWPLACGGAFAIWAISEWSGFGPWLAGFAVLAFCVSVAMYLGFPAAILIEAETVTVKFLLGGSVTHFTNRLTWKRFTKPPALRAYVKNSFVFGGFVLNLAWIHDAEELVRQLNLADELDRSGGDGDETVYYRGHDHGPSQRAARHGP
jgi:hypothetical protein